MDLSIVRRFLLLLVAALEVGLGHRLLPERPPSPPPRPAFGPAHSGLRLGLHVENVLVEGRDMHRFRLRLANFAAGPVAIQVPAGASGSSFPPDRFMLSQVGFVAVPPIPGGCGCVVTGDTPEDIPPPEFMRIEPGDAWTFEWTSPDGSVSVPCAGGWNGIPRFPGRYEIQARMGVATADGWRFTLASNAAELLVGGVTDPAPWPYARVLDTDAATSTVVVDKGSAAGLWAGAELVVSRGFESWLLVAREVAPNRTTCTVERPISRPNKAPGVPGTGAVAWLRHPRAAPGS